MNTPEDFLSNGDFLKIREALDKKQISSTELTKLSLIKAKAQNDKTNALIHFCDQQALDTAAQADKRIASGETGALLGIPIAVKDLILVKDAPTTAASKMLENFTAPYDATVVSRLRSASAPIIAKANLDEFAMGSSNETSFFGCVKNPWDLSRVPGGSSGGSAAAVAARSFTLSLGTDTGGSIRQPSSLCGITGLKPTYGRVSRYGVVAFASSLDQVGPMCTDALSCAAIMDVISGRDLHDATCNHENKADSFALTKAYSEKQSLKGLKIGLAKQFLSSKVQTDVHRNVEAAIAYYKSVGAEVIEIDLPHVEHSLACYYLICTSEASSNLARYDGVRYGYRSPKEDSSLLDLYKNSRAEGFGDEVKRRILLGTFALSSGYYDDYFQKAARIRRLISKDFESAFKKVDVIASPTSPFTAFKLGEKTKDPLSMYAADIFTLATNLAGLPAVSFNVGFDQSNLPIGLQLQGARWNDNLLLGLAALYQKNNPGKNKAATL
ncbi:Asp-tRNA(Asn)/Glu-tRNA(Gln) amidotransferase subunit GatA [bacterium]|nr:Asp-tRNA(Asn)/Glu-tRNA(Gln) amidotransferase subunit GatA [bacterium]